MRETQGAITGKGGLKTAQRTQEAACPRVDYGEKVPGGTFKRERNSIINFRGRTRPYGKSLICVQGKENRNIVCAGCSGFSIIFFAFVFCDFIEDIKYYVEYAEYVERFPSENILPLLYGLLPVAQNILLVLYLLKYYPMFKKPVLLSISLGLVALEYTGYAVYEGIDLVEYPYHNISSLIFLLVYAAVAALLVHALFSFLYGKNKNIFIISVSVLVFLIYAHLIYFMFPYFLYAIKEGYIGLWLLADISKPAAAVFFFVSLLIFCLKNKIPAVRGASGRILVGQTLLRLKYEYDSGLISYDEYRKKRAEAIKNL